jgi:hypothetical protein
MSARDLLQRAAILGIALSAATTAPAYPIPPAPLWRLVHDADAIVVAQVVSVEEVTPAARPAQDDDDAIDLWGSADARLHVSERWKGEIETDVVVPFEPNMVCPTPPRYQPGETVLAFLVRDQRTQSWQTAHLSYGTIYPSPEALPIYAERVREALALQGKKSVDRIDRIEWLVRCAEDHATRWNGLYELVGVPKRFLEEDEDGDLRIPPAELLTDEHRARIVSGFLRDPRLDATVPQLLEVLGPYRDARFDRAVVAAIDHAFDADAPDVFMLHAAVRAILARLGDGNADAGIPELAGVWQEKSHVDALRKAWVEAKAKLD